MKHDVERRVDEQDWARFRALERLTDHWWWRPGWRFGRHYLTFYILFGQDSAVVRLARHLQDALDVPYLDPVPPDGFHLTVQGVGFADEVRDAELRTLHAAAQTWCADLSPFPIEVGPVAGYSGGVFLRAAPWQPFQALRGRLRQAIEEARPGAVPDEPSLFKPHVSVAYCNSEKPAADLIDTVGRLRDVQPVTAVVSSLHLVALRRDDHAYRWDVQWAVDLKGR